MKILAAELILTAVFHISSTIPHSTEYLKWRMVLLQVKPVGLQSYNSLKRIERNCGIEKLNSSRIYIASLNRFLRSVGTLYGKP